MNLSQQTEVVRGIDRIRVDTRREHVPLVSAPEVAAWARQRGAGVLIIREEGLRDLQAQCGDLHLQPIAQAEGFNISKGKWVRLVALQRAGP